MKLWKTVLPLVACCLVWASSVTATEYGFGYQPSIGGAVGAVADHLGFFTAEGLDLKIRVFNDGSLIGEALAANAIQFGILGDLPTITLVSSGVPAKILAGVGGGGARQRLMVAEKNITSFVDLKGERIGVTRGTSGLTALQYLCITHNVPMSEFQIINIRPANMPEALASGQVKAVIVWEPTPSLIESAGIGTELTNLSQSELVFPLTIVARDSVIEKDRETVIKVMRALNRAAQYIRENPVEAAKVIGKVTGLDPEIALRTLDYHFFEVSWSKSVAYSLNYCAELLYQEKQLRKVPNWDKVVDDSFCRELGY